MLHRPARLDAFDTAPIEHLLKRAFRYFERDMQVEITLFDEVEGHVEHRHGAVRVDRGEGLGQVLALEQRDNRALQRDAAFRRQQQDRAAGG